jgi:hypothetical protein
MKEVRLVRRLNSLKDALYFFLSDCAETINGNKKVRSNAKEKKYFFIC